MSHTFSGATPLTHLGVIQVDGDDAASFLHGQLTQDFALLGLSEARLAGFCSAKGRLQASFVGFKRSHTQILLICSLDLLPQTLKRLSMFVLRAKAKLSDATAQYQLWGVAGQSVPVTLNKPWAKLEQGDTSWVSLYPAWGVPRALVVAPVGQDTGLQANMSLNDWQLGEVHSGIAWVTSPVFEAFVPQMLNLESVGGVNFKKGCYPGQEVVARSQFRGTLKRRTYLVHSAQLLKAGDEVFEPSDFSQPCGTVVQAAATEQGSDALVSMTISAAEGPVYSAALADEAQRLTLLPLPYPLLEDI